MTDDDSAGQSGIITKLSPRPVNATTSRLTSMIAAKGMRLFAVIDQSAEAAQAGLQLRETTLVIFGSPAAGTPVMAAAPLAALDLPLKVLIWDDGPHASPETADPRFAPLPPQPMIWLPGGRVKGACGAAARALRAP